jgi:gamma-glutamyltranspeptidase / glutathione hydrolase
MRRGGDRGRRRWLTRERAAVATIAFAALAVLLVALPVVGARAPVGRFAVSTESALSSREAVSILRRGGNAVDAAVTAALVAGVASPTSSGIGGGGFALVYRSDTGKVRVLDFRETAPAGVDASAFERRPLPDAERGHLAGVPGEVAGLFALHREHGKLPWREVVAPAVRAARQGFSINPHVAMVLGFMGDRLRIDPSLEALYFAPGKGPRAAGARVRNPALGKTLERIGAEGPAAFYTGPVAAEIARAASDHGSAMTPEDLAGYMPRERTPLVLDWEGYRVYTMPPPSAGGMMLVQTLSLFSRAELQKFGFGSGAYLHMLAEAARGAVADRMRHLGDPDHHAVDVDRLVAPGRMARRKASLGVDRTHALPRFGLEEHGTHHIVTADAAGNVVSLTTTVNRPFGARIVASGSGVVLNDELNDFTQQTDVGIFGMKESPNRPRPGARPVSSMTPTIVTRDGNPVLALGGSGGLTIGTNVTQVAVSLLTFGTDPDEALRADRFSIPSERGTVSLAKGAPEALVRDLEWRGEIVTTRRFEAHAVQLIAIEGDKKRPAADPRKNGSALAE